jgi:hypothetical protein
VIANGQKTCEALRIASDHLIQLIGERTEDKLLLFGRKKLEEEGGLEDCLSHGPIYQKFEDVDADRGRCCIASPVRQV